jgi:hypothetical protein
MSAHTSLKTPAISYRRALLHKVLHPLHEIRPHSKGTYLRYCRTCYVLRFARRKAT